LCVEGILHQKIGSEDVEYNEHFEDAMTKEEQ
jgi:hypothetical protein